METLKYMVKGQPISFSKANYATDCGFSNAKEAQLIWRISLQGQHEDKPKITTPMEVFFEFFFLNTIKCKQKNKEYKITPTIYELIKFATEMASGILWNDTRLIVRATAEKYYSSDPRTEITIIRLKE